MTAVDCVAFLQWALPLMGMRWPGFRKVRRQVCKRINRRLRQLELDDLSAYREFLDHHPDEWPHLDALCRISISRFYRDRGVFNALRDRLLPQLARDASDRGQRVVRAWSAGCASGEEAYTLKLVWELVVGPRVPNLELQITATDADPHLLQRARRGCYPSGSLKDLPQDWIGVAFEKCGQEYCLREPFRTGIELRLQDIRRQQPAGPFDVILCRHLVFTYFDLAQQAQVLEQLVARLCSGGILVAGKQEQLPANTCGLELMEPHSGIYRWKPRQKSEA